MTALEISTKNYDRFEDKKDITELNNALLSVESYYAKRDDEGNKIGGFGKGVFEAVAKTMRYEFVANKRCSEEVRNLCVEIVSKMEYSAK